MGAIVKLIRVSALAVLLLLARRGDIFSAESAEEPVELDPSEKLLLESWELLDEGKPGDALKKLLENKRKIDDAYLWGWWGFKGMCHESLKAFESALDCYNKSVALDSDDNWFLSYRARIHHLYGRWDKARADLDADSSILEEERESGLPEPLRVVVDGPFRKRWPRAWRKLEMRSAGGYFQVVSNQGVSDERMDFIEKEWAELDSENGLDKKKLDEFLVPAKELVRLAKLMELVVEKYMEITGMDKEGWPKERILKVFFFPRKDYTAFCEAVGEEYSGGLPGFYEDRNEFLALCSEGGADRPCGLTVEAMEALFHESWHQFYHLVAKDPPIWLDEGMAEVMGKNQLGVRGTQIKSCILVRTQAVSASCYETIKARVSGNHHIPFRQFFSMDRDAWEEGYDEYLRAEAWAICYYALCGGNSGFRKRFLSLLRGTTEGTPLADLLEKHFPGKVLDQCEADWLGYFKKL